MVLVATLILVGLLGSIACIAAQVYYSKYHALRKELENLKGKSCK